MPDKRLPQINRQNCTTADEPFDKKKIAVEDGTERERGKKNAFTFTKQLRMMPCQMLS